MATCVGYSAGLTADVVAAVSGKSVVVVGFLATATSTGSTIAFRSKTTTATTTQAVNVIIGGPLFLPPTNSGILFRGIAGEALEAVATGGTVTGFLWYYLE